MTNAIALPAGTVGGLATMNPLELATMGFLARYRGSTLVAYTTDLKHFFAWCDSHDLRPLQATRPHLELYLRSMETDGYIAKDGVTRKPYGSATINRRFNTVAIFYGYALKDEIIAKDPAAYVDRPKIDSDGQKRPALTPLQHGIFMAAAEQMGVMPYALASLLGVRGLRVGSACALNVGSVSQERGYDVITFVAKGNKLTKMALPVPVMRAVAAAVGDREEGPILLNRWGNRMDRNSADRIVQQIVKAAKLDVHITPHSLRRAFVMTGLASGISARDMQLAAGHASVSTTMIYDQRAYTPDRDAAHRVSSILAGVKG